MKSFVWLILGWILMVAMASSAFGNGFLYADMSFTMFCEKTPDSQLETKIENFLRTEGFSVLNYGLIEHGRFELRIGGLDASKHVIEFNNFPGMSGRYGVMLWTEPLTPRATDLEAKLEKFAEDGLNCTVRFVERQQNDAHSVELFNYKVKEFNDSLQLVNALEQSRPLSPDSESVQALEQKLVGIWQEYFPTSNVIQFYPDRTLKIYLKKEEGGAKKINFLGGSWSISDSNILTMKVFSDDKWMIRQAKITFTNEELLLTLINQGTSRHKRVTGGVPLEYVW